MTAAAVVKVQNPFEAMERTMLAAQIELAAKPAVVYLDERLGPGSRRTMEAALNTIAEILTDGIATARTCPWAGLRYEWTVQLPHRLVERGYGRASIQKHLAALRGVLREAWRLGLLDAESYQRTADVQAPRGEGMPTAAGRAITRGELLALFEACRSDTSIAGRRDAAIIALLYGCGLRRAEVVELNVGDVNLETNAVEVRGKGGKARTAYPAIGAIAALKDWLVVRERVSAGPGEPLFLPITRHGALAVRRPSDKALYLMLQKRASAAGVADLSPHDFRRTFIGDLLDSGCDLATAQQLAGHSSPTTTARYDRRGERAKREAAGRLAVPYR